MLRVEWKMMDLDDDENNHSSNSSKKVCCSPIVPSPSLRLRSRSMDRRCTSSAGRPLHKNHSERHHDNDTDDEDMMEEGDDSHINDDNDPTTTTMPPHQTNRVVHSAASWDELDLTTSQKRSTRKHAHFAAGDSACKKQRGTPIRKTIFTPIKAETATATTGNNNTNTHCTTSKRSFGTCTTASLAADESTDHSVDSAGTSSNFRFTTFPASLPRITTHHQQHHQLNKSYNHHNNNEPTTDAELYYYYSGDDEDQACDDSTVASSMLGTPVARLNFASAMMPSTNAPCLELPETSHHDPLPASFVSSVSSIAKNNISASCEEIHTESTATPSRTSPDTPREVQLHFQMPNCSPIPGIPEGTNESSISRPLPDSHAFDENNPDDDDDDTTTTTTPPHNSSSETSQVPALPHLRPPPTPIRIPTWSHLPTRPNHRKLMRSNSLLATKVLASDAATNDLFPEVMTLSGSFHVIGSPLGKGVFADVCKVQSKTDETYYAVKCQRKAFRGRKDRDMALQEVRCMLELQKDPPLSPYLLRFFKAWQEDERIHVLTELCCKDTCRQLLDKHETLPSAVVWKLLFDVASGLAHMHARNLIHNDIKPSNILLIRNDSVGAIGKIGDFGMTRMAGSTDDGQEGDQMYMALELLSASTKLAASSDIFSLGLTIYEASSSLQVPSHGTLWRQLRTGQHEIRLHDYHDDDELLLHWIQSMMHPDPSKRTNASSIVNVPKAETAGTSYCKFLADYIAQVDDEPSRSLCSPPRAFSFSSPQA